MDDDMAMGPIDFILLEFPDQEPSGEAADALLDLVEAGTIRLYDIIAVRKAADGSVSGFEVTDLGDDGFGFASFAGARSGLLGDDDVAEAAEAMEPGAVAVLIVYENAWATPFASAVLRHGGQFVASARIPVESVIEALDALDTDI